MSNIAKTDRQRREAAFYRAYATHQRVEAIDFAPVEGAERRPWNPYWYVYELVRSRFVSSTQRLLDFGCGIGVASLRFAHLGYDVDAFDLSEDNLAVGRDLAQRYELERRCRFTQAAAEDLPYADGAFDVIAGIDILHHVDIPAAIREAHRVLRPGGVAIFKEHIEVPVFDKVRDTAVGRAVAPRAASLAHHITPDERKLNGEDVALIQNSFRQMEVRRFTLLGRLDRFMHGNVQLRGRLQRFDHRLMAICPPLSRLGGTVVLICQK